MVPYVGKGYISLHSHNEVVALAPHAVARAWSHPGGTVVVIGFGSNVEKQSNPQLVLKLCAIVVVETYL